MESRVPGTSSEFLKTHEIVRAGAGAGKTYTLTHKVMDLADEHMKEHGRFPRVIVTTFTRKATQELRERLMVLALEEKPHLVDFVNSRSHLVVSTIHGVMDLYLKRYGANICIDPGYKIVAGPEASKLARQTLRQILLGEESSADLLESFPFNRLVALARRLDRLWFENPEARPFGLADFQQIFEERAKEAAAGLREAASRIREETEKENWVGMAEDYLKLAAILSKGDWSKTRAEFIQLREVMKIARKPSRGESPVSEETIEFAKSARESADEFRETLYDPEAWSTFVSSYEAFERIASRFSRDFRKTKLDQGLLEIADLEYLAMSCIREHPATVDAFWKEWDFWLIDEYQDTSPFQVELLGNLTGESPNFVVGDPQQSIYLFRGARSEVFGEREKQILEGGGSRRLLTMNRRSRPELLLFLNDFFSRLDPPFQPMEPFFKEGQVADPERVVATVFVASKPLPEESGAEAAGEQTSANEVTEDQEMRAIVAYIQDLLEKGAKPEDICVLARTNAALTEVASWLSRFHLPTHVHAAAGFYDRREIRDALAFMKFLVNPHDNFNLVELLRSPWFKMPDDALAEVARQRLPSLWDALLAQRSMADQFKVIGRLQSLLQFCMSEGISETFKRGLIAAGFIDLSHVHDVSGRRESNLWKLLARLQQEECRPGFNPLAFIHASENEIRVEESNAEGDAVAAVEPDRINLMTVHASKGLEFLHVILPRMEQKPRLTNSEEFTYDEHKRRWAMRVPFGEDREMTGSLPESAWLELFRAQELQEHARVLYVALTRAVESVFLSWTGAAKKDSWAEMVKLDLAPGLHEGESYSYLVRGGEPELKEALREEDERIEPRKLWREPVAADNALGILTGSETEKALSVTQILDRKAGQHFVHGSDVQVARLLKLASTGTAVHRLMELLKYPSRERMEQLIGKWFPGQEQKVLEAVAFVRTLEQPPLLQIIANGDVEWGFAISVDGLMIEGQIDLWGRTDQGEAWIVDYKTGNPELRDKAFEQMALYAFAVRRSGLLRDDEPLKLAAIYPFAREVYIQDEPPREKVLAMLGLQSPT
jgi:ATP-dependent helicase/nuclease subunit A